MSFYICKVVLKKLAKFVKLNRNVQLNRETNQLFLYKSPFQKWKPKLQDYLKIYKSRKTRTILYDTATESGS